MSVETQEPNRGKRFRYSEAPVAAESLPKPVRPVPEFNWQWVWIALAAVGACLAWFYWRNLVVLGERWVSDAGWSHGFVVPLISIFFIRLKWERLRMLTPVGSIWGIAVLLAGIGGQVLFSATGLEHMSGLSLLVVLYGLALFVFGWEYLKVLWLPISFLMFALPPPGTLYGAMTLPMQRIAGELGVQLLPLFGGSGERSGTLIEVWFGGSARTTLGVEEACSGMRMLVAFFALAVALAYSTDRPVWQKVTLAAFALPVAIICNGFRVALSGLMAVKLGTQWAHGTPHEFLGLLMLGPALLMQLGLAWVLDRLFVEVPETKKGAA
jgi:exosortase